MRAFFVALQFLTRIKLVNQTAWTEEDFGKSVLYFPFIGFIIGAILSFVYWICSWIFPYTVTTLILVVSEFILTGGIHADGFMDTCDGLFSGRERERKLEIMKDSRVGSFGVVGFVFLTLLKWQLLTVVPPFFMIPLLLCMPLLSRFSMILSIRLFHYARPQGMGKAFADLSPSYTIWVGLIWALLPIIWFGHIYFIFLVATVLINYLVNTYISHQLGGLTGDTYGFVTEFTELLLVSMYAGILFTWLD